MIAWAINNNYADTSPVNQMGLTRAGAKFEVSITSKLDEIGIDEGDNFILLIPKGEDLQFSSFGVINSFKGSTTIAPTKDEIEKRKAKRQPPPHDKHKFKYELLVEKPIESNNLLSDLEYSIRSVYRFSNPAAHFYSQFRSLPKDDYETIINGWVYAARTAFGKLVNSLPRQNKLEFMLMSMEKFETIDFKEVQLLQGLEFLYNYIDRRILNLGRLLVETDNILENQLKDIVPHRQIGLINPEKNFGNEINIQASFFRDLLTLEKETNILKTIESMIEKNQELENRFKTLFNNETWPIDLRA